MRELSEHDAKRLKPGADHYTAYVGPPWQYDFMGATQFALLFALGLREHHTVLDFGCGSLRAGRLLIPYLNPGRYFGIEPNGWLVEEGINRQLGRDILSVKSPAFSTSNLFSAEVFEKARFDFIVAQSIFSHAGPDKVRPALQSFSRSLKQEGVCVVTFIEGDCETPDGWHYPGVIQYRQTLIRDMIEAANMIGQSIPWWHPRQRWWLIARDHAAMPSKDQLSLLRGIVLRADEFANSIP